MEIGPYRLKDGESLEYNDGAWDEFANLLFIDNPVGTGFSSVDSDSYIHELTTMADNMVAFFEKYFDIFPEQETNDVRLFDLLAGDVAYMLCRSTLRASRTQGSTFPTWPKRCWTGTGTRARRNRGT